MKKLITLFSVILLFACSSSSDNEDLNNNSSGGNNIDSNPVYLDDNGWTVKAKDWAKVGDIGTLRGAQYIVVDEKMLYDIVASTSEGYSNLVTTKVTNMSNLFEGKALTYTFQSLTSWDVSNVTNMSEMFKGAIIETGSLNLWDVSNVKDMSGMFEFPTSSGSSSIWDRAFDGNIIDWDVSNVTNMSRMFYGNREFNRNLSSWNVSKVIECNDFSYLTNKWSNPKPNFTNCNPD